MNSSLRGNRLVGLAVGASIGFGLMALIIYRQISKKKCQRLVLEARPGQSTLLQETTDAAEIEAQQQALAAVEAVVHRLSPEQQLELRNKLDQVLNCMTLLRSEVAELRGSLQDIALQIVRDIKKGVEENPWIRRRHHVVPRERTNSTSSSSIYFTASQGMTSTYEETSEAGYSTAYAESDNTDHDTDRDEQETEPDSEEEEDRSCITVVTVCQEDFQEEVGEKVLEEEDKDKKEYDEGQLVTEVPSGELALLLAQSDILHTGDASLKAEGFRLLLDNRGQYGHSREFLWRMARAYSDMYSITEDKQEKETYKQQGQEEAELALKKNCLNAECHKWFAVLTVLTSQHENMDGKLKSHHILKEHLDRAIALRDDDPICFYLLGKWCYEVTTLDWLDKKTFDALYQSTSTTTLHDALENFFKAEQLSPGFSKAVRLYIAKCHKALGNISEATNWTALAQKTPFSTNYDEDICKLEAELLT
ncbi:regulator of microtubule dynamics protein 3 isoform X2 [Mugil cephalus]|uniref:regulator of microtubule dynamics protein 3 isoform X2 n=1 Tax=Mugil cephalus TaxID=48193 RepID=UPI001FB63659|nr:regulator of microtubule dynamics protein 3 isoform X2 [Mugil cephalus]